MIAKQQHQQITVNITSYNDKLYSYLQVILDNFLGILAEKYQKSTTLLILCVKWSFFWVRFLVIWRV